MALIRTDQPSTGKPLLLFIPESINSGFVNTTWTTLAEAPYFSVPSGGDSGSVVDPGSPNRRLRPGEVFLETPLAVINRTATTRWVELRMLLEGTPGQPVFITPRVPVPAGEGVYLPVQGLRLLKTNLSNSQDGGRLQVQAEVNNALTVFGTATELEAQDHAPDSVTP